MHTGEVKTSPITTHHPVRRTLLMAMVAWMMQKTLILSFMNMDMHYRMLSFRVSVRRVKEEQWGKDLGIILQAAFSISSRKYQERQRSQSGMQKDTVESPRSV